MQLSALEIVLAAASLAAAPPAGIDPPVPSPRSFACPIGGEAFTQSVDHPHFPLVQFPDASHLGDEFVDAQIPECPSNKLPILPDFSVEPAAGSALAYHDYTAQELDRLAAVIEAPEWKALAGATRHQRAYWLATRLGRPANDRIQLLIRAQWATSASPALHRQAVEQLVRDLPGLVDEARLKPEEAIVARFLRINALRELGRFAEARSALEEVERSGAKLLGPNDPDAMFDPGDYALKMRGVIDAGDDDRFAIDLLPDGFARRVCAGGDFARLGGTHAPAACAARKKRKQEQEALFDRAQALQADLPALEKRCAEPGAPSADEALAYACRSLVHKREWAEGQKLAEGDPLALARICETTSEAQRTTVQVSACTSYQIHRDSVATALLTKLDGPGYARLCSGERSSAFMFGCGQAYGYREHSAARRLLQDRAALGPKCASRAREEDYSLELACQTLTARTPPFWLTEDQPVVGSDPISRAALPYVEAALRAALEARP